MKAIILAAGNGIRMRPLTDVLPKPLLNVGKLTLLDHLVSKLPVEIDELIIVVRHLGHKIKNYCGLEFYGRKITYVEQPKDLHGTFAALKICEKLLKKGERFFVLYADDLMSSKSVKECLKYPYAIVASEVSNPTSFGVLELNEDGTLAAILEKPEKSPTNLVLTNILLLDTKILKFNPLINANGEQYLTHAVCDLAKEEKINIVRTNKWLPVGYPEDLKRAAVFIKNRQ